MTVKIPFLWYRRIAFGVIRSSRLRSSSASALDAALGAERAEGAVAVQDDRRGRRVPVGHPPYLFQG